MDMIVEAERIAQRMVDSLVTGVCYRSDMVRLQRLHGKQHAVPDFMSNNENTREVCESPLNASHTSTEVPYTYWRTRRKSAELLRLVSEAEASTVVAPQEENNSEEQHSDEQTDEQHTKEDDYIDIFGLAGHGVERHNSDRSDQTINDKVIVPLDAELAFLQQLAHTEDTPVTVVDQLVKCFHMEIREALADNSNTPVELLMILARDESCDIRYALAENHNIPKAVLELLSADDNPYVQYRAQRTLARLNVSLSEVIQPQFGRATHQSVRKLAAV